ncbi:CRISPR-associated protein Cas4 [uncultured Desulfovibrio sp.]|uniref:CRISPR-associated protein Cas4 n=1 Tax=uncultured Desulfovibrio sp. TaxID=167968 RepID=UPI001C3B7381|nr:CRISPR-associated protein Cas4 [uncultured Desulfovibrio sp.]HIX41387.1 CRISPR-associated protein Cas4 [Candidatus Desulfovibrio intestinigallinarum]
MTEIMLSALQHYAFCPRQCALIHLEQVWQENSHTAEGRLLHATAHESGSRMRGSVKTAANLELCSKQWGLYGRADIVEFLRQDGLWIPYPVEYKKGRLKDCDADEVQLCGQALCLEEMLAVSVEEGALYYGAFRRRHRVTFSPALRKRTMDVIAAVRVLLEGGRMPPAQKRDCCASCSLNAFCLPGIPAGAASRYIHDLCENDG